MVRGLFFVIFGEIFGLAGWSVSWAHAVKLRDNNVIHTSAVFFHFWEAPLFICSHDLV